MAYVQSTALEQLSYDERAHTFRATGRIYVYRDVPQELYDGLIFAVSLGAFFQPPYRRLFDV